MFSYRRTFSDSVGISGSDKEMSKTKIYSIGIVLVLLQISVSGDECNADEKKCQCGECRGRKMEKKSKENSQFPLCLRFFRRIKTLKMSQIVDSFLGKISWSQFISRLLHFQSILMAPDSHSMALWRAIATCKLCQEREISSSSIILVVMVKICLLIRSRMEQQMFAKRTDIHCAHTTM